MQDPILREALSIMGRLEYILLFVFALLRTVLTNTKPPSAACLFFPTYFVGTNDVSITVANSQAWHMAAWRCQSGHNEHVLTITRAPRGSCFWTFID